MTLPFKLERGHVVADLDGGRWLIDTGSPWTFGRVGELRFLGRDRPVSVSPMGLSIEEISEEIGNLPGPSTGPFHLDGLLGCDLLAGLTLEIHWARGELAFLGQPADTRSAARAIPRTEVRVGGRTAVAVLDTGAFCTYVVSSLVAGLPRTGSRKDFLPSAGRFEAAVVEVDICHDEVSGTVPVSIAPEFVSSMLAAVGASVIIGNDVMSRSLSTRIVIPEC